MFVWTDIETTGLIPTDDWILSLGMIITDDAFKELARFESAVFFEPSPDDRIAKFVLDMHTENGLWERCKTAPHRHDVEKAACAFLDKHLGPPAENLKDRPVMAGNSVHFDKSFLDYFMCDLMKRLNYRILDVSTLKVLAYATVPGARAWDAKRDPANHTPLKDLEGSLAELAHWRAELKRG